MTTPKPAPDLDFPALTSLRWLAALLVFVYHFPPPVPDGVLSGVVHQGHVGVTIFFVLSGFLITLRYLDATVEHRVPLRDYVVKRVARILPLYLFVLAATLATTGSLLPHPRALAEWTMTQGFFREVFREAHVPTSWSLTVEECFYAMAPLLFLSIAAATRRRPGRPLAAAALALAGWMLLLAALGAAVLAVPFALRQRLWGLFGDAAFVVQHTLIGRLPDFAAGSLAAVAFLRAPALHARLARRGVASALAAAGLAVIVTGQWAMDAAGGLKGPDWALAWPHNGTIVLGSVALIVALTRRGAAATRVMEHATLVYLGRVSYALYLIQLTPLGKTLVAPLLPAGSWAYLPVLYLGMTAVAAALYELVEHPAHGLVLRLAGKGGRARAASPVRVRRRGWAAAAIVAVMLAVRLFPSAGPTAAMAGFSPVAAAMDRSLVVPLEPRDSGEAGVRVPDEWAAGPTNARRSPPVLVFVDGVAAPLLQPGQPAPAAGPSARFRSGYRGRWLTVSCAPGQACREVRVVRDGPGLALAVVAWHLVAEPLHRLGLVLAAALVLLLAGLRFVAFGR